MIRTTKPEVLWLARETEGCAPIVVSTAPLVRDGTRWISPPRYLGGRHGPFRQCTDIGVIQRLSVETFREFYASAPMPKPGARPIRCVRTLRAIKKRTRRLA